MGTPNSEILAPPLIDIEEKDKLVAKVIRYMLFKSCPVTREELTGIVTKDYRHHVQPSLDSASITGLVSLVIDEARDRFAATFGYEMRELQRTAPTTSSQPLPDVREKSYVLVSQLNQEVYSKYVEDKEAAHQNGFAFTVISLVHLAGGQIREADLWRHLKRLGLKNDDDEKQRLQLVVNQRYLLRKKELCGREWHVKYELAERANDESFLANLKNCISKNCRRRKLKLI
ncbi:hypothetical protein ACP70R_037100 [Stipagrostis hirtigluma subsp. patula]